MLGRRLCGELSGLLESVPEESRTARGLARFLNIDRGTAQRAISAARLSRDPIEALAKGPGTAGLRQIVRGAQDAGLTADAIRGVSSAADLFESALRELGISQSGLVRAIEPPEEAAIPGMPSMQSGDSVDARRRLFEAASECVGRVMDARTIVMMVRPKPQDPAKVEIFGGHGVIGYRARPDVMPLVLGRSVDPSDKDAHAHASGAAPVKSSIPVLSGERVLMEFCTDPLALVTSRRRGRELHAVVEPRGIDEAVDVVLASNAPDDDENSQYLRKLQETRFNIRVPARAAVFDVYLERSLAQNCVPSLEMFLWPREARSTRPGNWYDALPSAPLLQVLGTGIRKASSAAYPRQAQLTERLFEASAWNPDQFVGFRCETAYPFWASCYTMNFDYGAEPSEE